MGRKLSFPEAEAKGGQWTGGRRILLKPVMFAEFTLKKGACRKGERAIRGIEKISRS